MATTASQDLQIQANPSRFYLHFIYKVVSVAIVLVVIPLFPSQAPDFVNQTVLSRGWELVHLLFVGIAVSYGLFSRRNVEIEKEHPCKSETAQTYVSGILQVSSVFDDGVECPNESDVHKFQTWNSQCFRGDSNDVIGRESSDFYEQTNGNSYGSYDNYRPLFLPVRSLKSPVLDGEFGGSVNENGGSRGSPVSRSDSDSDSDSDSRIGSCNSSAERAGRREIEELGTLDLDLEEELEGNGALPSPIPWRSRSGRMEMREEVANAAPAFYSPAPSIKEFDTSRLRSRSFHAPRPYHQPYQPESPFGIMDMEEAGNVAPPLYSPPPAMKESDVNRLRSRSLRAPRHNKQSYQREFVAERMEMREKSANIPPLYNPTPSMEESGFDQLKPRSSRAPMQRHQSSQPDSTPPLPNKLSPSYSFVPELRSKSMKELGKKNASSKSPSPPPTNLPDPESLGSPIFESHSSSSTMGLSSEKKYKKNDLKDESMEKLSRRRRDELRNRRNLRLDSLKSESKTRTHVEGPSVGIGRSVRTFRTSESVSKATSSKEIDEPMDGEIGGILNEVDVTAAKETGTNKARTDELPLPVSCEKQKCETSNGEVEQNSEVTRLN
ncbi:hypothetical protein Syun_018465 [Stephania yunnanensis]|uniref:Uncharacterized protein n=1 Tax=Stephania yunnanensis TaxID=152371 RepID=A0AAP0NVV1_9MAGN